ncbi:MAG: tetratricopeptide repeat-containing serine protease family protein, partial [Opitutaceae bacterium]|nr:tetratricopeptide repeat-containing serine protease family protein [Opitutaceae bacterium]
MKRIFALALIYACLLGVCALFAAESLPELRAKAEVLFTAENLAELRAKAEGGDAKAQADLGFRYFMDEALVKHRKEALIWFRKAADQGDASSQTFVGTVYAQGEIVAKDPTEAAKWYRKAAEQNYTLAQYFLGDIYAKGEGVAKDPTEAVKWYRKAAEQNYAPAQLALALMYYSGQGVAKNMPEGVRWDRKAAYQGNTAAQGRLGVMYQIGQGVLKDEIEALAWLNLAALSGDNSVVKLRSDLEHQLGPQRALLAQRRSKEILKQVEASGAATAPRSTMTDEDPNSTGSGAIVSSSGYVLTAAHVVAGAAKIKVVTVQGSRIATIARLDESNDLAILKIDGGAYTALPVSPSRRIRLGQSVATIGFPNIGIQGFSPKLTRGEISSINGFGDDPRGWQISVPVQPGNSGGPLLDEHGNLIGVIVAKLGLRLPHKRDCSASVVGAAGAPPAQADDLNHGAKLRVAFPQALVSRIP